MNDSPDDLYVYEEGGETIIEIPNPDEYRNARPPRRLRPRDRRSRREHRRTRPVQQSRRVVIRRPDAEEMRAQPYPADEAMTPVVEQPPEYGMSIGGVQVSFATVAGTLLTLGDIGVQLGSHFVNVPEPPTGDQDDVVDELVQFNQEKKEADRKLRLLDSIGRALSDVGQLAAFRR